MTRTAAASVLVLLSAANAQLLLPQGLTGETSFYATFEGKCGEVKLSTDIAKLVEEAVHLTEGTCGQHGYSVERGSKTLSLPAVGSVVLALYTRSPQDESRTQRTGVASEL